MAGLVSYSRVMAVMAKEFIQMRRDRLTFAMIIGVPILQLILFGYAINTDPKELPTVAVVAEQGPLSRAILAGMKNSAYFDIRPDPVSAAEAREALAKGTAAFAVSIPAGFERDIVRGEQPSIAIEADATDPAASSNGIAALSRIIERAVATEAGGPLPGLQPQEPVVDVVIHRLYNPEAVTRYNIVPGLLGTILTLTCILMTALALTREVERGTMENLLAMPARPFEIMVGKIVPYIGLGLIQVVVILVAAEVLFNVPMLGPMIVLIASVSLFIAANVTLGYTFSSVARTQMQAMQMTFFFFLPSMLLSGFMFPFRGMPQWAQWLGEVFPLTHFLRIVRAVMLKGAGMFEVMPHVWPLALFWLVVGTMALVRYRRTLD